MKLALLLTLFFSASFAHAGSVDRVPLANQSTIQRVCANDLARKGGSFLEAARSLYRVSHRVTREGYPDYDGTECDQYMRSLDAPSAAASCSDVVQTVTGALASCWNNVNRGCTTAVGQRYAHLLAQAGRADYSEALGAAAYEDTDYQASLDLNEISQGRAVALPKLSPQRGNPDLVARGGDDGGITITGHGGDSDEQIIKLSLLRAVEGAKVTIKDLDPKYWPTKKELRALVSSTPVTIVNYFTMPSSKDLCRSYDGKTSARGLCGGFVLKGATGTPFLLVAREFAAAPQKIQQLMLEKIFMQMVTQVAEKKAGSR